MDPEGFKLYTCPCKCPRSVTELSKHLPDAEISTEIIRKELEVETTNLTANVRRKISAPDERGSSASFGVVALAMLAIEVFLFTFGDFVMVVFYLKQRFSQICRSAVEPDKHT